MCEICFIECNGLVAKRIGSILLLGGDQSLVHVRVGAVTSAISTVTTVGTTVGLRHTVSGNAPIPLFRRLELQDPPVYLTTVHFGWYWI